VSRILKRLAGLYYGWRMIGIVSALRVLGGGLHQYGFTVFFLPVTQDLGLTRASTLLAFSLARAEESLPAPIVGYLLDRYGPKPLMLAAALFAGVGYILFAFGTNYTTFLIVYLGVISLAFNAGFVHAPAVVANSRFIGTIRGNMNLFYTWGAILGPFVAGAVYDRTLCYALVFAGITVSLVISDAMTSLLIIPWKRLQEENQRSFEERPAPHSSSR
jgi:MFS family permease